MGHPLVDGVGATAPGGHGQRTEDSRGDARGRVTSSCAWSRAGAGCRAAYPASQQAHAANGTTTGSQLRGGGQHPRWPREGPHGDEQGAEGEADRQLADDVRPEPAGTRDLEGLHTERLRGQRHARGRTRQQGGPSRDRAGVPEQEEGAGDQEREGRDGHLRPLENGVAHGVPGQRHLDLLVHVQLPDLAPHLVAQDVAPTALGASAPLTISDTPAPSIWRISSPSCSGVPP